MLGCFPFNFQRLHDARYPSVIVGSSGCGKSSTLQMFLATVTSEKVAVKKLAFSSATTPGSWSKMPDTFIVVQGVRGTLGGARCSGGVCALGSAFVSVSGLFQASIETEVDRRGGKSYGPPPGTTLTFFVDDMSMPEPNVWGDQPTLELLRQQLELGGMYFLSHDRRGEMKSIEDVQV